MRAQLRDYRAIARADIPLDGITLVAGPNEAGKTSIVQGVTAMLTGEPLLVPETLKRDAGELVRDGAKDAAALLTAETGQRRVSWPKCEVATRGDPPTLSPIAAGRVSIVDLKPDERARTLVEILDATPTIEDLTAAIRDTGLFEPDRLDGAARYWWKAIVGQTWDGAAAYAAEQATMAKGAWAAIAGGSWSVKKGDGWTPEGWRHELESMSADDLDKLVALATGGIEKAIAARAVGEAEIAKLREEAGALDEAQRHLAAMQDRVAAAEDGMRKARETIATLPSPADAGGMPCPHCGGLVRIEQVDLATRRLVQHTPLSEAEKKARFEADHKATAAQKAASDELRAANKAAAEAGEAVRKAEDATRRLADLQGATTEGQSLADARAALEKAKADQEMVSQRDSAAVEHRKVTRYLAMADVLKPGGVRKQVLEGKLQRLNGILANACKAAAWPAVAVREDLAISYGGRRLQYVSASAQYRVRVVLQVVLAKLVKAPLAIIDAADILDEPGRRGLFRLLRGAGMSALVTATVSGIERLADFDHDGIAHLVWLNDGRTELVAAGKREAA